MKQGEAIWVLYLTRRSVSYQKYIMIKAQMHLSFYVLTLKGTHEFTI